MSDISDAIKRERRGRVKEEEKREGRVRRKREEVLKGGKDNCLSYQ